MRAEKEKGVMSPGGMKKGGGTRHGRPFRFRPSSLIPHPFRLLSGPGMVALAIAALLLFVGWYKNINLLLLLGYILVGGVAVNVLLAGWRLERLRGATRPEGLLFAGEPAEAVVTLDNPGPSCWGVEVVLGAAGHKASWFVLRLPGRQTHLLRRPVLLPGRGRHPWGPVEVVRGYPFGLSRRRVALVPAEEVIVLPRVGTLHRGRFRRHLRGRWRQGERATRPPPPVPARAPGEFHKLRGYRHGDSSRAIHWRTTARRGELMVVEYSPAELAEDLLVVFDPTPERVPGAFEEAVSLAATLCREWCRRRGDRLILACAHADPVVVSGITGIAHARRVLECLALQQPGAPTNPTARRDACPTGRAERLIAALPRGQNPWLSAVVISAGPSPLSSALRPLLRCEVCALETPGTWDFYDPPSFGG